MWYHIALLPSKSQMKICLKEKLHYSYLNFFGAKKALQIESCLCGRFYNFPHKSHTVKATLCIYSKKEQWKKKVTCTNPALKSCLWTGFCGVKDILQTHVFNWCRNCSFLSSSSSINKMSCKQTELPQIHVPVDKL